MDQNSLIQEMLKDRVLFMEGDFTEEKCNLLMKQMLYLVSKDDKKDITIYIDSYGGEVNSFLQIYNLIDNFECKVNTIVTGKAMSAGAYLLLSGTGQRSAFKYSQIMLHELGFGRPYDKLHDQKKAVKHSENLQKILNEILLKNTNVKKRNLPKFEEDQFYTPEEARKEGIIDIIY